MKRGGLAAAQLKRHAGGTSTGRRLNLPTHVTECRVDNPSCARRFVNLIFQYCDKRFRLRAAVDAAIRRNQAPASSCSMAAITSGSVGSTDDGNAAFNWPSCPMRYL